MSRQSGTVNDSILELDELTKWSLDSLEFHLWTRGIEIERINEILMNIWEEDLQEEGFKFINATRNKKEKFQNFMNEFNRILRKIRNGEYDNNNK